MARVQLIPESLGDAVAAAAAGPRPEEALAALWLAEADRLGPSDRLRLALALRRDWPESVMLQALTDPEIAAALPAWQGEMLGDLRRAQIYDRAIAGALGPGMTALVLGAGTGVLALMAARTGARVLALEANPVLAGIARMVIAQNGYGDRVEVIEARLADLEPGRDLPRADVCIHALFGARLVEPGCLATLERLRGGYLAPDALLLPDKAALIGQLDGRHWPDAVAAFAEIAGFDLGLATLLQPPNTAERRPPAAAAVLSTPRPLLAFRLDAARPPHLRRSRVEIPASSPGRLTGLLQWIRIGFPDGSVHENAPGTASPWEQVLHPLPARSLSPGDAVAVGIGWSRDSLWIDAG